MIYNLFKVGLTLSLLFLACTFVYAQPSVRALNKYMDEAKAGSYKTAPDRIFKDPDNTDKLLAASSSYLTDSVDRIRSKAYNIIKLLGLKSSNTSNRTRAVSLLTDGLDDSNNGISATNITALTQFKREDFDSNSRNKISGLVTSAYPHIDKLAKLIGYLRLTESMQSLRSLPDENLSVEEKWAIRLALVRMNDDSAIQYVTGKLVNAPVNDDFVYDIVPDLIYTRNMDVFEFLESIIQSDENNCRSANPDSNARILCGYRVLEYIAYAIEDFPVQVDEYNTAIIDDYETTLLNVRNWFTTNPTYTLRTEIY
ncbi:MAG: hypothetical protein WBA74_12685 [Cyclobacteriaceae bacterium]